MGRIICVGDRKQAIYGFRGADITAIPNLLQMMESRKNGCKVFPLSTCRRCPKSHIRLAQAIVPDISYCIKDRDGIDAPEGEIYQVSENIAIDMMMPGDLGIARTNKVLIPVCYANIRLKKKCIIRGRDIGKGLLSLIDRLRPSSLEDLLLKLNTYVHRETRKMLLAEGLINKSGDVFVMTTETNEGNNPILQATDQRFVMTTEEQETNEGNNPILQAIDQRGRVQRTAANVRDGDKHRECKVTISGDFVLIAEKAIEQKEMKRNANKFNAMMDKVGCIEALCDGIEDLTELRANIEKIFAEFDDAGKPVDAIVLGTVHRTKGLEAFNIFVIDPDNFPHKMARKPWEIEQEHNLAYIAATRAKFQLDNTGNVLQPGRLIFMGACPSIYRATTWLGNHKKYPEDNSNVLLQ